MAREEESITCKVCNKTKHFSHFNILNPSEYKKMAHLSIDPELYEEVCKKCKGERKKRKWDAWDEYKGKPPEFEDYIYSLGTQRATEIPLEEAFTVDEYEAHSFSFPLKKQWFKCSSCGGLFPSNMKYRNKYKKCPPCGEEYNRKSRLETYYRKKEGEEQG